MEEIDVQIIRLQSFQLLVQKSVKLLRPSDDKHGQFGHQVHFFPVTVFEDLDSYLGQALDPVTPSIISTTDKTAFFLVRETVGTENGIERLFIA